MADHLTKEKRSWNMSRIRAKNTEPEIIVRKFLHSNGYRYGLHNRKMPGKPDIVLRKYNTVIFVNGCYWHRHEGCSFATTPKSNKKFWLDKFSENTERDKKNIKLLEKEGWKVFIVWECEVNDEEILREMTKKFSTH